MYDNLSGFVFYSSYPQRRAATAGDLAPDPYSFTKRWLRENNNINIMVK
jgi:hypothetical protein